MLTKTRDFAFALLLPLSIILYSSCATFHFQKVEVEAVPIRHTVRVTNADADEKHQLSARLNYSLGGASSLRGNSGEHTPVTERGTYEVDAVPGESYFIERHGVNTNPFDGDNFFWRLPKWQAGLDLDLVIGRQLALTGGINLAHLNGRRHWRQNMGIGWLRQDDVLGLAWRMDLNLQAHRTFFDAEIVERSAIVFVDELTDDRRVYMTQREGESVNYNFAAIATLNSVRKQWLLNYFITGAIGEHTFADIGEATSKRTYFSVALGFYKATGARGRVVIGLRMTSMLPKDARSDPFSLVDAFLQYDLNLF